MTTFAIILLLFLQILLMVRASYRDAGLFEVMLAALILKMVLIIAVFPGSAANSSDAAMYFDEARSLVSSAGGFRDLFDTSGLWGTRFIVSIAACVLRIIGPSQLGLNLTFALPSFWGSYFYYRAFQEAFPRGNLRFAEIGLFLYPSIVFWTALLGKDGLIFLFLSVVAYARARLQSCREPRLWLMMLAGIAGCSLIRPHIGALAIVSIVASFMFGRKSRRRPVSRFALIVLLAALSLVLVYLCAQILRLTDIQDAQRQAELSATSNQQGASGFERSSNPLYRFALSPLMLVRPFPWEIDGAAGAMASAEGMLLLAVIVAQRKRLPGIIKSCNRSGFSIYLYWFVLLNLVLLGQESSNFGLLVRQRVMILPLIVILILGSFGRKIEKKVVSEVTGAGAPSIPRLSRLRLASRNG